MVAGDFASFSTSLFLYLLFEGVALLLFVRRVAMVAWRWCCSVNDVSLTCGVVVVCSAVLLRSLL
ncbi:hypothetical protein BVRB_6g141510 [Beta vulgaris subsp. vulgaris]|nr:hypothetical protein BVRB_6g141510 [Beta vulgaris subsp. vulgaris]